MIFCDLWLSRRLIQKNGFLRLWTCRESVELESLQSHCTSLSSSACGRHFDPRAVRLTGSIERVVSWYDHQGAADVGYRKMRYMGYMGPDGGVGHTHVAWEGELIARRPMGLDPAVTPKKNWCQDHYVSRRSSWNSITRLLWIVTLYTVRQYQ